MQDQNRIVGNIIPLKKFENGSLENGTVRSGKMLAVIKNRLYLCSAFETQMPKIEY